jgi:hypothetical protein
MPKIAEIIVGTRAVNWEMNAALTLADRGEQPVKLDGIQTASKPNSAKNQARSP